jgi:hypothetical protein
MAEKQDETKETRSSDDSFYSENIRNPLYFTEQNNLSVVKPVYTNPEIVDNLLKPVFTYVAATPAVGRVFINQTDDQSVNRIIRKNDTFSKQYYIDTKIIELTKELDNIKKELEESKKSEKEKDLIIVGLKKIT